jgi:argininosuccinate lyase
MPQKKNPEVLELMRGRSGVPLAAFSSLFVMTKGLISGYSQDLQETKPHLWQSLDVVASSLDMLQEVITKIEFDRGRMKDAAMEGYIAALDLAEVLTVDTGIPFRVAHEIVAKLVRDLVNRGVPLREARQEDLAEVFSATTGKALTASFDFKEICDPVASVRRRKSEGSPNPAHISQMLASRRSKLNQVGQDIELEEKRLDEIESELLSM